MFNVHLQCNTQIKGSNASSSDCGVNKSTSQVILFDRQTPRLMVCVFRSSCNRPVHLLCPSAHSNLDFDDHYNAHWKEIKKKDKSVLIASFWRRSKKQSCVLVVALLHLRHAIGWWLSSINGKTFGKCNGMWIVCNVNGQRKKKQRARVEYFDRHERKHQAHSAWANVSSLTEETLTGSRGPVT